MVKSLNATWNIAMGSCAVARQIPYLEDDQVTTETWIGKAMFVRSWGKKKYKQFIAFNLSCIERYLLLSILSMLMKLKRPSRLKYIESHFFARSIFLEQELFYKE